MYDAPAAANHEPLAALAANAFWLSLTGEDLADNLLNYQTIASNGCLDGRIFHDPSDKNSAGNKTPKAFSYETGNFQQGKCNHLKLVLDDIEAKLRVLSRQQIENECMRIAATGGIIGEKELNASFEVLLEKLADLNEDQLIKIKDVIYEMKSGKRPFWRQVVQNFCEKEKLNIVITDSKCGLGKGKEIIVLKRPHINWSGHALYALVLEHGSKPTMKRIDDATNKGCKSKALVRRKKGSGEDAKHASVEAAEPVLARGHHIKRTADGIVANSNPHSLLSLEDAVQQLLQDYGLSSIQQMIAKLNDTPPPQNEEDLDPTGITDEALDHWTNVVDKEDERHAKAKVGTSSMRPMRCCVFGAHTFISFFLPADLSPHQSERKSQAGSKEVF
jgi:hypothetical protein